MPDLRSYRLTVLLAAEDGRKTRESVESLVQSWVSDHQGEVRTLTATEKRHLAYQIAHTRQATEIRAAFTAPRDQIRELADHLRRESAVIRVRLLAGEMPTGKRLSAVIEKKSDAGGPAPAEKAKPRKREKIPIEKLDEKLDEILEEKVL